MPMAARAQNGVWTPVDSGEDVLAGGEKVSLWNVLVDLVLQPEFAEDFVVRDALSASE